MHSTPVTSRWGVSVNCLRLCPSIPDCLGTYIPSLLLVLHELPGNTSERPVSVGKANTEAETSCSYYVDQVVFDIYVSCKTIS